MSPFIEKNASFWKWGAYAALACFVVVVGWSIYHLSPSLFVIAAALCLADLILAAVYTVFTTVPSPRMRRTAWICEGIIAVAIGINVAFHVGISRKFDTAVQRREAYRIEKEADQKAENEKSLIEIQKMEARAQLLEKEDALTKSQTDQLRSVNRDQRRLPFPGEKPANSMPSAGSRISATVSPTPKPGIEGISPEDVQEQGFYWIITGILIQVGAIIGSFIFFTKGLTQDRNKNNTPDYQEEGDGQDAVSKVRSAPLPSSRQPMGFAGPQKPTENPPQKPAHAPLGGNFSVEGSDLKEIYPPQAVNPLLTLPTENPPKTHRIAPTGTGGEKEILEKPTENPPQPVSVKTDTDRQGRELDWVFLAGWKLPKIIGATWEDKVEESGSLYFELWPSPRTVRNGYYGRLGVRKLKDLEKLPESEGIQTIREIANQWIKTKPKSEAKNV